MDADRCPICGTRERKKPGTSGFFGEHWVCPAQDSHTPEQNDAFNFQQWVD